MTDISEISLNIKVIENGNYTLTIYPESVKVDYLHLVDNQTGADVDLLQTPSYTFEAKPSDSTSRFKLVLN